MEFTDRTLVCADCGQDFIFTAGEQLFFHGKEFKNDPKRCKACKVQRSVVGGGGDAGPSAGRSGTLRTETRTVCSACGVETTVPFKPTQGRPVLCRRCFQVTPRGDGRGMPPKGVDRPGLPMEGRASSLETCELMREGGV